MINPHIPNPHAFNVNLSLQSAIGDLPEIITKLNEILPQLSGFIDQFNSIVLSANINVVTDTAGNLAIDVPTSMPDNEADKIGRRVAIIDRLIINRTQEIASLIEKGSEIESRIKEQNPQYTSQILGKINEFNRLKNSYNH